MIKPALSNLLGHRPSRVVALSLACAMAALAVNATVNNTFQQPTATPALSVSTPDSAYMQAVTLTGERLVAVGLRGMITYSDDAGKTWTQTKSPVDIDLVAVTFSSPDHGWAVGHQGVLLETTDKGQTWSVHFSDMALPKLALEYYQSSSAADAATFAGKAQATIDEGTPYSLLDIHFETPESGYIVGSFNTMFHTADGGKTWQPMMDKTGNTGELHFYSIRGNSSGMYTTGERGMVWRLDPATQQWKAVPSGYTGTLFGLLVDGQHVIAYGMRGSIYRTDNGGTSWQAVDNPQKAGILASKKLSDGSLLLANQAGGYLRSTDGGATFTATESEKSSLAYGLTQAGSGELIAAGPFGVSPIVLK